MRKCHCGTCRNVPSVLSVEACCCAEFSARRSQRPVPQATASNPSGYIMSNFDMTRATEELLHAESAKQTPRTTPPLRLADRMSRLGTETAFEVLVRARALEKQGKDIVHLEIGEPDFDTPANVIEAASSALHKGWTHYGPSAGLPDLRQAIADDVSRSRGVPVSPDEVVVVPGGKPIIFFTILSLVETGDEVIYPNPGFPIYESMINFVGAKAVPIQLREEMDFRLDVNELADLI